LTKISQVNRRSFPGLNLFPVTGVFEKVMSEHTGKTRARLRRILSAGIIAVAAVVLAVGGLLTYSVQAIDRVQVESETKLVERKVARALGRIREHMISATVWNEAYTRTLARDLEWMQFNYGDYFADYMEHDASVAYAPDGTPIQASRDSEPVTVESERAFITAVAPLVGKVKEEAKLNRAAQSTRLLGLEAIVTREATIDVGGVPYFVSVSTVVAEDPEFATSSPDPIVASGMAVSNFVPTVAEDLGLISPELLVDAPAEGPFVSLTDPGGKVLGHISWRPAAPGASRLMGAIPVLLALLGLMVIALSVGVRRVYGLINQLAVNEQALDLSLSQAEASNAAKSQFLANMSHELRTPLNGIIALTELLERRQSDPTSSHMARTIVASGRTLEHVVNDILDVAKIEAGQLKFELAPFSLGEFLGDTVDLHRATAEAKGIRLELLIPPAAEGVYEGDRTRIGQVVSNLVSNAVKFTQSGSVRVTVRRRNRGVCIYVADTGIGFDRSTADRLFQRFEQADISTNRKYGGTGLGLSICRSLTEMMGGCIGVRSRSGAGSVFAVQLPLQRLGETTPDYACSGDDGQVSATADASDAPLRILFADDHPVNRQVVALILEPLGIALTEVEDGAMAVEAYTNGTFDLVLMDVQMPVMDGLAATRAIREIEKSSGRARTPIVSITANAMPEDVRRSLDAGSDTHLAKPIRPDKLIDAVNRALANEPASSLKAVA
jgi:signal transduction histidine kinase/CheY-like chemotaxis protein